VYARAFAVLLGSAGLSLNRRRLKVDETRIGEIETSIFSPKGAGTYPAIVLMNGATPLGREHPRVRRLAAALARAGHVVFVPDVPGLDLGQLGETSVVGTVAAARAPDGPVALVGISAGASLALLAAARPELDGRVSAVAGLAAYTDLRDLIRIATTTGTPTTFLTLSVARSVCAALPAGGDREILVSELAAVAVDDPDPLACLRGRAPSDAAARAALDLLTNTNPARFDALYAELPDEMRRNVDRLSPVAVADRLRVPVELVWDARDRYFPLAHAQALQAASPSVRVTVISALAHTDLSLSPRAIADLGRVAGALGRTLRAARVGYTDGRRGAPPRVSTS
jgi:dienelactone hydrolase